MFPVLASPGQGLHPRLQRHNPLLLTLVPAPPAQAPRVQEIGRSRPLCRLRLPAPVVAPPPQGSHLAVLPVLILPSTPRPGTPPVRLALVIQPQALFHYLAVTSTGISLTEKAFGYGRARTVPTALIGCLRRSGAGFRTPSALICRSRLPPVSTRKPSHHLVARLVQRREPQPRLPRAQVPASLAVLPPLGRRWARSPVMPLPNG